MPRTRIKFCGVTRPEDALAAAAAGADAIGMVFYPPAGRRVTIAQARLILAVLPPFVTPVGLFVDQPISDVIETAHTLGLQCVQLHGNEPPEYVEELNDRLAVIKAIRAPLAAMANALAPWRRQGLTGLLLETPHGTEPGGTGFPNDWAGLLRARETGLLEGLPPIIAAGGLTPETVGDVVRSLWPFAVDVSTGIELSRGIKSVEKMIAFAKAVRDADG